jgi:hypothetical protein
VTLDLRKVLECGVPASVFVRKWGPALRHIHTSTVFRLATLVLLGLLATFARAAAPTTLYVPENKNVSLPESVPTIWFFVPGLKSFPNGITVHRGGPNKDLIFFALPYPVIAASRVFSNGRWSSIAPIILLNDGPAKNTFKLRSTFEGTIKNSEPMRLPFTVKDRKSIFFEIIANRIGSKLDPVARILDAKGREIGQWDDYPITGRDPRFVFTPSRPGSYTLEVRDVANGSGPDYFLCVRSHGTDKNRDSPLHLGEAWIEDSGLRFLWRNVPIIAGTRLPILEGQAQDVRIPRSLYDWFESPTARHVYRFDVRENQKLIFTAKTREIGEPCDARLKLFGDGKKIIAESTGSGPDRASITNRFEKSGSYMIEVTEISRLQAPGAAYWLTIDEAKPGVVLTTEVERVDFSKDGEAKIKIACQRYEYNGPVKLRVDGLPEGVEVVEDIIPEKKNEFELKLKRTKEVEAFQIRVYGTLEAASQGTKREEAPVSTMPALKKLFPLQMFPTAAMDGWIAVNPPTN